MNNRFGTTEEADRVLSLDPRLAVCASFLRGRTVADIGTDHAYLPVSLVLSGKAPRAVASDIAQGPLASARRTLEAFGVTEKVTLRRCDGLSGISPDEAEDIVIAGMGGELIARIIEETPWLRSGRYRLVLQPMTKEETLRRRLCADGFEILGEQAVVSARKVYTVLCCEYRGEQPSRPEAFYFSGLVDPGTPAGALYFGKVRKALENRLRGARIRKDAEKEEYLRTVLSELNEKEKAGEKT